MNETNENPKLDILTEITDADMLAYLIKENGKLKEEIATEIKERFWLRDNMVAYFNKV